MFFKRKPTAETQFLERLKGTPVVQEAMREVEAQELAARQALVDEMTALQKTLGTFTAMRSKREAEINAEIVKVETRRTELGAELMELDAAGSRIRGTTNSELLPLLAQIKAGADSRINNFEMWARHAHTAAVAETWKGGPHAPLFMMEVGTEKRVARNAQLALESVARLGSLVTKSIARAEAMRLEAALPDDVMLELQSMAAEIHAEYSSQPKSQPLAADFLARIPGLMVIEVSDINEVA